jgi:hypothetical protein
MSATSEARALPFFTDLYGQPLESGTIYIGQPGLDPVAYPQTVYSDSSSNTVLAQPIRTTHGHAVSAGAQVHMYTQVPYSITVLDAAGRTVYSSLNEIDPTLTTLTKSSVQSVGSYAELRARTGGSSNQVYVANVGLFIYVSVDNTSPESLPFVVVGNDGSRYYLDLQDGNFGWLRASRPSINPALGAGGGWLSWNDANDGTTWLTNNKGAGVGGFVLRNVNADNTSELGRVSVTATGGLVTGDFINSGGKITTLGGDIQAAGNLISNGGNVVLTSDLSRSLSWDAANQRYVLAISPLLIQGSLALTQASLISNQLANGVGSYQVGNGTGPTPTLPGTWQGTGTAQNGVYLWQRVV